MFMIKEIVQELDFMEYRSKLEYVSVSELKSFIDSPYSYHKRYIQGIRENKKSSAFAFGTLVHCLVLEPHKFEDEYMVSDVRRDERTKKYQAVMEEAGKKTIITPAEYEKAKLCQETAAPVMSEFGDMTYESSYFYQGDEPTDAFMGLKVKARADAFSNSLNSIVDVKTTSDLPTNEQCIKTMFHWKYHLQIAWYLDIHEAVTGIKPDAFYFVFVQSTFPYASVSYKVSEDIVAVGREEYKEHLGELKHALTMKDDVTKFPRMKAQKKILELPYWKQKKQTNKIKEKSL